MKMNFIKNLFGFIFKTIAMLACIAIIGMAILVGVAYAEAKSQVTCQANGLALNDSGLRVQQVCTDGTGYIWTEYRN